MNVLQHKIFCATYNFIESVRTVRSEDIDEDKPETAFSVDFGPFIAYSRHHFAEAYDGDAGTYLVPPPEAEIEWNMPFQKVSLTQLDSYLSEGFEVDADTNILGRTWIEEITSNGKWPTQIRPAFDESWKIKKEAPKRIRTLISGRS